MPLLARRNLFHDEVRLKVPMVAGTHPVCDRHTNLQMIPCSFERPTGRVLGHICPVPSCGRHHDDGGYFDMVDPRKPQSLLRVILSQRESWGLQLLANVELALLAQTVLTECARRRAAGDGDPAAFVHKDFVVSWMTELGSTLKH
jgi:hypothetical protein